MAFTDTDILQQIQYVVIETPDGGVTWDSGLWTHDEVTEYLDQRQNMFLKDTHFQFGIALIDGIAGTGIYDLPDDWINTIRVLWIAQDGTTKELPRSDTWEADNGIPTWSYVNGVPLIFYDGGKPITLRIMPTPAANGTIQVHYVPYSALLTGDGELMTLPGEFVPPIKYGALSDMFSKVGRAQDPIRAQYCEQRYQLGLEVARLLVEGYK